MWRDGEYFRDRKNMKNVLVHITILAVLAAPAAVESVELVLRPSKTVLQADKLSLTFASQELASGQEDARPLYEKASQALPDKSQSGQMSQWLKVAPAELPVDEVKAAIKQYGPAMELIEKAARCKQCKWPPVKPGAKLDNLGVYRELAVVLAVRARLEIAQGQYGQALSTLRTGLAMAGHIGRSQNLVQSLVGVAIGNLICQQLEQLVQGPQSPNLHAALQNLPRPLIDVNEAIQSELANIENDPKYVLTRRTMMQQLKPAHDKVRLTAKKLDRHITALQCVEAVRLFAGRTGALPKALSEITDASAPDDPVTGKPFIYQKTDAQAVLEGAIPEGGQPRDTIRYELSLGQ